MAPAQPAPRAQVKRRPRGRTGGRGRSAARRADRRRRAVGGLWTPRCPGLGPCPLPGSRALRAGWCDACGAGAFPSRTPLAWLVRWRGCQSAWLCTSPPPLPPYAQAGRSGEKETVQFRFCHRLVSWGKSFPSLSLRLIPETGGTGGACSRTRRDVFTPCLCRARPSEDTGGLCAWTRVWLCPWYDYDAGPDAAAAGLSVRCWESAGPFDGSALGAVASHLTPPSADQHLLAVSSVNSACEREDTCHSSYLMNAWKCPALQ